MEGNKELDNVIIFQKKISEPKKLSDTDIKSLFMGLVKLVKSSAISDAEKQNKVTLSKSQMVITIQEEEIANLEKKNQLLNKKLLELKQRLAELRCEILDNKNNNQN